MEMIRKLMGRWIPGCDEASELQWQQLEDELSLNDISGLKRHLLICRRCRGYRDKLHFVKKELEAESDVKLTRDFKMTSEAVEKIKEGIEREL